MATLILVAVIGFLYFRALTPEYREQIFRALVPALKGIVRRIRDYGRAELEPFQNALHERSRWALVTPALIGLNVGFFVIMLFGGAGGDDSIFLRWGASSGPRTTNGEWWRLVTAAFVHGGFMALLVNMTALWQLGSLLERLIGRPAFALIYFAAVMLAGLTSVSSEPIAITMGASGAVSGLYGLLVASVAGGWFYRSGLVIPVLVLHRCGPMAAIFVLYNLVDGTTPASAELVGLITGVVLGLAIARDAGEAEPARQRTAIAGGITLVIAIATAIPLRGLIDVRPELQRIVDVEQRTASTYQTALANFKSGKTSADGLARLIDRAIVPELKASDARMAVLRGVPHQDRPRVADAREYLRLRSESWNLRAEALRQSAAPVLLKPLPGQAASTFRAQAEARYRSSSVTMGKAERAERASLEALGRLLPPPVAAKAVIG